MGPDCLKPPCYGLSHSATMCYTVTLLTSPAHARRMATRESVYFSDDDQELLDWIDEKVEEGRFASRSHGIRFCIQKTMERGIQEFV